jgi:SAM-dependent methyltransferase
LVLDPFCGCGTAIAVAQRLNRRWIGIDITHLAVALIKHRLHDMFGNRVQYKVVGEPVSLPDAKALAEYDPYQFQWWALGLVGARPIEEKKGADRGIDGRLYFHDEADSKKGRTKQIILSVKSGKVSVKDVRDLR